MIVKAIYKDKDFDYFNDKVTGEQRYYGDIFMCDDDIAQERIKNKFVKKATKEEEKEYYANQTTVDDGDLKPSTSGNAESNTGNNGKTNDNESELHKDDDESIKVKPLEECTLDELKQIIIDEDIPFTDEKTKEQFIETINKVRADRLEQSNNN